jgi:hypothetical protein
MNMQVTINCEFHLKEVDEVMDMLANLLHEQSRHKKVIPGLGRALATAMVILDQVTQGLGGPPVAPSYSEHLYRIIDDLRDVPEGGLAEMSDEETLDNLNALILWDGSWGEAMARAKHEREKLARPDPGHDQHEQTTT